MHIKVREAITKKKTISEEVYPALYLNVCDCCGTKFTIEKWCNDTLQPGKMSAIFDKSNQNGNMFSATICSLRCADTLFTGGWEKMKEYSSFKKIKAKLVRVTIGLTSLITFEDEAIENWENKKKLINKV